MLDASGLDLFKIARKLADLLDARKVVHYQGEEVGTYEDGIVQARALELLTELRGLRKGQVDLNLNSDKPIRFTLNISNSSDGD